MLFEGLSRRHALRLIEFELNQCFESNNTCMLKEMFDDYKNTIFKDAFYLMRFIDIFVDVCQKTHRTLPYILRNQYTNAKTIFEKLTKINDEFGHHNLLHQIFEMQEFGLLYKDINTFIVLPCFKRYNIYSPNLILIITLSLYINMLGSYLGYSISDANRDFMRRYLDNQTPALIDRIVWLNTTNKEMMKIELDVWKSMHYMHRRSVKSNIMC